MTEKQYPDLPTLPHPERTMTWTTSELLAIHKYARDYADATCAMRAAHLEAPREYVCPTETVADLVNNLLLLDQTLPIYAAQSITHDGKRRTITVPPTVSRERVKDGRWIGEGAELNAAVIWTRAAQPETAAVAGPSDEVPIHPQIRATLEMLDVPVVAHISSHERKLLKPGQKPPAFESAVPLVREWDHRRACEKIIATLTATPTTQAPQPVEPAVSQRLIELLRTSLENCVEDSEELINAHIASYGEKYRPERLAAMRKVVADARYALTLPQEAAVSQGEAELPDSIRVPLDSLHADAEYLVYRADQGHLTKARIVGTIRERVDAAKAGIRTALATQPQEAAPKVPALPPSYQGSSLIGKPGGECAINFHFGNTDEAVEWHESLTGPREAAPSQDAVRLAWVADGWTPGHDALYVSHVLQVGGVGDLGDIRTFIDKMMIAEGRTQAKDGKP